MRRREDQVVVRELLQDEAEGGPSCSEGTVLQDEAEGGQSCSEGTSTR